MPPILGSRAIHLPHLLARSSSPTPAPAPSSMVPNVATLATAMRPSRRNVCNYSTDSGTCRERYDWLAWRVLPVLGILFCYSQDKQNNRINKLMESVAELNGKELKASVVVLNKEKEKEKTGCCCAPPPAARGTTASSITTDPTAATTTDATAATTATTTDATAATTTDATAATTTDAKEKEEKTCCCCSPPARGVTTSHP